MSPLTCEKMLERYGLARQLVDGPLAPKADDPNRITLGKSGQRLRGASTSPQTVLKGEFTNGGEWRCGVLRRARSPMRHQSILYIECVIVSIYIGATFITIPSAIAEQTPRPHYDKTLDQMAHSIGCGSWIRTKNEAEVGIVVSQIRWSNWNYAVWSYFFAKPVTQKYYDIPYFRARVLSPKLDTTCSLNPRYVVGDVLDAMAMDLK